MEQRFMEQRFMEQRYGNQSQLLTFSILKAERQGLRLINNH